MPDREGLLLGEARDPAEEPQMYSEVTGNAPPAEHDRSRTSKGCSATTGRFLPRLRT